MKKVLGTMVAAVCLAVAVAGSGWAQEAKRPKIGLVLGGGGARGAAHVGILKVLEENRVPVDFVVGTSMGSIVGGLYAIGNSPAEIDQKFHEIPWTELFADWPTQDWLSFRRQARPGALHRHRVRRQLQEGPQDAAGLHRRAEARLRAEEPHPHGRRGHRLRQARAPVPGGVGRHQHGRGRGPRPRERRRRHPRQHVAPRRLPAGRARRADPDRRRHREQRAGRRRPEDGRRRRHRDRRRDAARHA